MSLDFATINLPTKADEAQAENHARVLLEKLRWPTGPICPHCGSVDAYRITPRKQGSKTREGLLKCKACRKQFTVTVGTIFEDSHIPLRKWLNAIHLLCASKKGMSAHQLHRMLHITYKSAWFMAHRIRYAMTQPPIVDKLGGIVEADETYVGGKDSRWQYRGRGTLKAAVLSLVSRDGQAKTSHLERVNTKNLREAILAQVDSSAHLMTDEWHPYRSIGKNFARHDKVKHTAGEYVRGDVSTNRVESYFATLKRGINGVYHHVSKKHLHRYLDEFDFRYNRRKIRDGDRASQAVLGIEGKRLMYRDSSGGTASL